MGGNMCNKDTSSYTKHTEETCHGCSSPVQDVMEVTQVQSKDQVSLLDVHSGRQHEKRRYPKWDKCHNYQRSLRFINR